MSQRMNQDKAERRLDTRCYSDWWGPGGLLSSNNGKASTGFKIRGYDEW